MAVRSDADAVDEDGDRPGLEPSGRSTAAAIEVRTCPGELDERLGRAGHDADRDPDGPSVGGSMLIGRPGEPARARRVRRGRPGQTPGTSRAASRTVASTTTRSTSRRGPLTDGPRGQPCRPPRRAGRPVRRLLPRLRRPPARRAGGPWPRRGTHRRCACGISARAAAAADGDGVLDHPAARPAVGDDDRAADTEERRAAELLVVEDLADPADARPHQQVGEAAPQVALELRRAAGPKMKLDRPSKNLITTLPTDRVADDHVGRRARRGPCPRRCR